MKKHLSLMFKLCVLYFLSAAFLNAQLPNDCSGALVVCDDSTLNLDALGTGVQEVSGTNDCNSAENNSIWLKINIQNSGTFGFILTPNSTNIAIDYDFFLYGPDVYCGAIGKAIRCSTTNPAMANMSHNQTGMNSSEIDLSEGPGRAGNSFVRELNVLAKESYFLVIDRPIGMSPFSLEWTGTATLPPLPTNPIQKSDMDMDFCDSKFPYGDGITEIDLTDRTRQIMNSQNDVIVSYHLSESDANLSNRPLGIVFDNVGNPQKIYMKTQNTITGCYRIDEFEIHVDRVKILPEFSTIETICAGTSFRLPTISKNNITGTWAPPFDTTKTTKYTFTPDPGQCAIDTELSVKVVHPDSLSITALSTAEPFGDPQKIEVQAKGGSGTYEYKLNNRKWQSSHIFNNVTGCENQRVSVRDLKACQNIKSTKIIVLYYPRYFTPNGDGFNDYWAINCLKDNYKSITIYDRFGKFLSQLDSDSLGWDGTYEGVRVPSSDYWFIVTYMDDGVEKQFKSHFSLKR